MLLRKEFKLLPIPNVGPMRPMRAAVVRTVDVARGQFGVQFLHSGLRHECSAAAHTWRRVTDDASDLDGHVRSLLARQDARGPKRGRE